MKLSLKLRHAVFCLTLKAQLLFLVHTQKWANRRTFGYGMKTVTLLPHSAFQLRWALPVGPLSNKSRTLVGN